MDDKIKRLKEDSAKAFETMQRAFLAERFVISTHARKRLRKALAVIGRLDLVDRTLLSKEVHQTHANKLADRFIDRFEQIKSARHAAAARTGTKIPSDQQIANNHIRFCTILDSVTPVDAQQALSAVKKLKENLSAIVDATKGIWCLGAIEVEVISMAKMRAIRDRDTTSESEHRKLELCEILADDLQNTLYQSADSLFLVHFHGIIAAKQERQFDDFRDRLTKQTRWTKGMRQIELKKLSEEFNSKKKPVVSSLKHIATYITKGGNDWNAGNAYFNYKFGFEGMDEDSWIRANVHRDALLKQEHREDGIEDPLSLTVQEISELAVLIDGMMNLNRTRTGYQVSVGSR